MTIALEILKGQRSVDPQNKALGTATVANTVAMITAGLAVPATSSTVVADLLGIFNETVDAGVKTTVDVEAIHEDFEYKISTTNNSNAAHNGQAMVLTNAGEINNTGTTSATGIFIQTRVVGLPADKEIFVKAA